MDSGYPENNGLIIGGVVLRRHNEKDCRDNGRLEV